MIQRMFVTIDTNKTSYKNVGKINHGDDLILELTVLSETSSTSTTSLSSIWWCSSPTRR